MMSDGVTHHSAEMSFRITQDGRFFSRLMAKETSTANSSSRVFYYGETSVAVPFMWEAQPGTPKHPLSETSLPPLTPLPSYHSSNKSDAKRRNSSKAKIISSILPRLTGSRKSHVSPTSSSWSPSSSASSSSSWSLIAFSSSSRSPSSTPGFPLKHKWSNGFKGWYPFGIMKRMQL